MDHLTPSEQDPRAPLFTVQPVYLAAGEYDQPDATYGSLMRRIAVQLLQQPDGPTLVEVHEHGGWWLSYAWVDGRFTIVSTANDQWQAPPEIVEFWKRFNNARVEYRPAIRREATTPPAVREGS
jgi:hypothetical protein